MWRQFTQWLGGMGIIVLAIAVLPRLRVGGRQLLEAELPGPEIAQLSERIRETARLLWVLYVGLTAVLILLLAGLGWLGIDDRMTLYEAVAHAFGTMPTGGFSTQPDSAASFSRRVAVDPRRSSCSSPGRTTSSCTGPSSAGSRDGWCATRSSGSTSRSSPSRPSRLTVSSGATGSATGEEAIRNGVLPDGVDHHDDRAWRTPTSRSGRRSRC